MTDLERFLTDFMAKDHDSLAQDDDKWITIHPNGTDNRAVMIDDKTGVIKKGLAIGLIGTKLKDIRDNFKDKAKIEQHKARAEGEKALEVKEPEKKQDNDSEKEFKDRINKIARLEYTPWQPKNPLDEDYYNSIRQMSGQVSRGSAGKYQADEWAGIARTSWRLSVR